MRLGLLACTKGDLRSSPDRTLDWLAQLLQLVEDGGKWPVVLAV